MRQALAYLLILSFAFLATPKEVFHSHEHDHDHDNEMSHEHSTSFDEDCFVCDFDYTSLSASVGLNLSLELDFFSAKEVSAKSWNANNSVENISSRGPPALV